MRSLRQTFELRGAVRGSSVGRVLVYQLSLVETGDTVLRWEWNVWQEIMTLLLPTHTQLWITGYSARTAHYKQVTEAGNLWKYLRSGIVFEGMKRQCDPSFQVFHPNIILSEISDRHHHPTRLTNSIIISTQPTISTHLKSIGSINYDYINYPN